VQSVGWRPRSAKEHDASSPSLPSFAAAGGLPNFLDMTGRKEEAEANQQ
jgi:hypothetical protein